jgi:hypothetical protein
VLELERAGGVAERPDPRRGGALVRVDDHEAVLVHVDPGRVEVEQVGVGGAAGREQQHVDVLRLPGGQLEADTVAHRLDPVDGSAEQHLPLSAGECGEPGRDVGVLLAEQDVAPVDLRHVRAVRREDVGELRPDEPAADDADPLRKRVDPHHGVAGVVRDGVQTRDVGDPGAGARRDHDLVRGDLHSGAGVDLARPGEPAGAVVNVDVGQPPAELLARVRDRVDPPEDPVPDRPPVGWTRPGPDAECRPVLGVPLEVGRVDEHLRGDAPDVETGAAEAALLEDRDPSAGEAVVHDRVAGTGADDGEVVVGHPPSIRCEPARTGTRSGQDRAHRGVHGCSPRARDEWEGPEWPQRTRRVTRR